MFICYVHLLCLLIVIHSCIQDVSALLENVAFPSIENRMVQKVSCLQNGSSVYKGSSFLFRTSHMFWMVVHPFHPCSLIKMFLLTFMGILSFYHLRVKSSVSFLFFFYHLKLYAQFENCMCYLFKNSQNFWLSLGHVWFLLCWPMHGMIERKNNNFDFELVQQLKMFNTWTLKNVQVFQVFQIIQVFNRFRMLHHFL